MFGPVCFIYDFLSPISKAQTLKRTLLQTDKFFQPSDKIVTCLTSTQIKILGISEKQIIKLDIFVKFLKERHFFNFKTIITFFFISYFS